MSAVPITQQSKGRVLVADGVVYLRELEEHDEEVARIVAEADDPVAATSSCLRIGARALRAAHVSVDVDVIERSFADLEHRFETKHPDKDTEMLLYELGVDEGFRRRGIGRALVDALGARAREHGCTSMWVLTEADNDAALATYAAAGAGAPSPQVMVDWTFDR